MPNSLRFSVFIVLLYLLVLGSRSKDVTVCNTGFLFRRPNPEITQLMSRFLLTKLLQSQKRQLLYNCFQRLIFTDVLSVVLLGIYTWANSIYCIITSHRHLELSKVSSATNLQCLTPILFHHWSPIMDLCVNCLKTDLLKSSFIQANLKDEVNVIL